MNETLYKEFTDKIRNGTQVLLITESDFEYDSPTQRVIMQLDDIDRLYNESNLVIWSKTRTTILPENTYTAIELDREEQQ